MNSGAPRARLFRKPKHAIAEPREHAIPARVRAAFERMHWAVYFHHETNRRCEKIHDEAIGDDDLAPEPNAETAVGSDRAPERGFAHGGCVLHAATAFGEDETTILHGCLRGSPELAGFDLHGAGRVTRPRRVSAGRGARKAVPGAHPGRGARRAPQGRSPPAPAGRARQCAPTSSSHRGVLYARLCGVNCASLVDSAALTVGGVLEDVVRAMRDAQLARHAAKSAAARSPLTRRVAARSTNDQHCARPGTTSPVTPARKNTSGKPDPTPTPLASRSARFGAAITPHSAIRTSTHSACVTLARAQPASRRARATPAGEHAQQGTRRPQPEGRGRRSHSDAPQPGEHQDKDQLEPVAEIDATGVVSHFIYASRSHVPDLMVKSGVAYRLLVDQLGSVRMVVRVSDGVVMQQIDYDPWGVPTLVSGDWDVQPFGFAGGLYDSETGLVRFGWRDYDTLTGRWTAKDPIRFDGGVNLYSYANSDPVNYRDPTGLQPLFGQNCQENASFQLKACMWACYASNPEFDPVMKVLLWLMGGKLVQAEAERRNAIAECTENCMKNAGANFAKCDNPDPPDPPNPAGCEPGEPCYACK
jgi:RHS repeat-associated protein